MCIYESRGFLCGIIFEFGERTLPILKSTHVWSHIAGTQGGIHFDVLGFFFHYHLVGKYMSCLSLREGLTSRNTDR